MPTTYSTNLGTQLMQTGENAGTWGVNTNFNLGTLMEQAISSYVTQAMATSTTVSLALTDGQDAGGNTTPGAIYSTGTVSGSGIGVGPVSARNMYIQLTGTGGGGATLEVPVNRKLYFIYNNTNGAVTVKVSGQTGISVPAGKKYILVCNGIDIFRADSSAYGVSVASSNGFAGTSDGADNPTLTLSTTAAGILKGVSGALTASTVYSDDGTNAGIGVAVPYWKLSVSNGTINGGINPSGSSLYFGTQSNHSVVFRTNNTDKMTLDSTGNLGLNVTPSSWNSSYRTIEVGSVGNSIFGATSGASANTALTNNAYFNTSSNWIYARSSQASTYEQTNGSHRWSTSGSTAGVAGNTITFTQAMTLSAAGGLSVGTTTDPGAGAIYATGNITAYYSDDRLKTRKGNIENALSKVLSLDGFHYEANETAQALGYKAKPEVGLSAQQVQAVLPEVVVPAPIDEQYLTVHYERLIPLLVEAIKEQNKKIEALEARLNGLR